jgi:O-antigen/teichoic acid export membrane protein
VGLITAILAFAVGHTTVGASGYSLGLLFCLVVSVMANHVLNHFLALTQVELRYGVYNVKTWLVGTTNTLGAGLVALVSGDFLLIFVLLTASYLLTLFIVAYSLDRGRYALERPLFDKVTFRGLIRYGLQNFLGTVAGQLEFQGGKYVLSALPPLTVNAFTLPQNIIYKLSGALTTGSLVLFPLSGQMSDPSRRPELRRLYYHVQGLVLIASLAFVALVAIWGQALLTLWLGAGSLATAAYPPLRLLSYFFVLMSLTPVASVVVNALGYPIYTSLSAVATAALNTLLLFIFTPTQGAYGAALAILVSSAVTTPLFLYVTERVLQENKLQY